MHDLANMPLITFPPDLRFGSATTGHQIEGDNIHCHSYVAVSPSATSRTSVEKMCPNPYWTQ